MMPDRVDPRDAEIERLRAVVDSIKRFGTYLDPKTYGDDYDHHTFTAMQTSEGTAVALYRLDDAALADGSRKTREAMTSSRPRPVLSSVDEDFLDHHVAVEAEVARLREALQNVMDEFDAAAPMFQSLGLFPGRLKAAVTKAREALADAKEPRA